jgi:uncharacterized protein YkwD
MRIACGMACAALLCAPQARAAAAPDLAQVERRVVQGTNEFRQEHGRGTLGVNAKLAAAAQEFARFMARTGKYSHDADGRRPRERVLAHGYRYCMVAENISYQFSSEGFESVELASRLLEGWKRSPGHRANMLDGAAVHTAVALARSSTGYFYAVQLFGSPHAGGSRC